MDKIRTKIPRDRPHDIVVWQNQLDREVCGRLDCVSVLLLGHWSVHFFLVLVWAPVVIQHCKSRHLRNGHVQNFSRQDVDVAGVQHGQTGPGPHGSWLLICGVQAAESTKVSLAPWNLFAGMGTSDNQHRPTSNVVDCYVESDQHQWSHDQRHTHICALHTGADKELVISYAIIARSLVWAAWTCSHIQLQVYFVTEFTTPQSSGGL